MDGRGSWWRFRAAPAACARCRARSKAAHSGNCVRPPRDGRCGWSPCRTSSSLSPEFSHWRGSGPMNLRRLIGSSSVTSPTSAARSLAHTRALPEAWCADYNHERPHSRLGWMSPTIYAAARPHRASRSVRLQSQLDKSWGQRQSCRAEIVETRTRPPRSDNPQ
jgi:transposase InsO family protein